MSYQFYIVDVFAETRYAGNQLAVVRNAEGLSSREMQMIAGEMNYSETTFILGEHERNGGFDVRIFTPGEELPFAGHPTLGTAFIIQQCLVGSRVEEIGLNLQVGRIPVRFSYRGEEPDILWMRQIPPTFGPVFDPEEAAKALNIEPALIDTAYPLQEVSTGLPFIIVPLKSLEAVRACLVDRVGFMKLVDRAEAKMVFVFCPETYSPENQFNARMFDSYHGIGEDPATGSANGCLAAYLLKYRYLGSPKVEVRVEQGYEIGRPSILLLRAEEGAGGEIEVSVGGRVIMVARGELL